ESFEYPAGFASRFDGVNRHGAWHPQDLEPVFEDGERTARLRSEQEAAQGLYVEGGGNCAAFQPGRWFRLRDHFRGDGQYLLTHVEHHASQEGVFTSAPRDGAPAHEPVYQNRFRCSPQDVDFRPPRTTPRPRIDGTQTAVVVGPVAGEPYVDRFGRIKV